MHRADRTLLPNLWIQIIIAGLAIIALSMCFSGKVYANGWTRGAKNTTEAQRAALCYDTSPANKNVTTFGAVWINDTPTTDTSNARWDENMVVAWNATYVTAYMWTTAYNCPASQGGVAFNSAQIYSLAAAAGGSVPISFPYGTSINRGTGTTYPGQFTNPPGGLRVRLNVTGKASGCYSVAYSGRYRDNRGTGLPNTYFTRVCITRQAVPPATLDGVKIDDSGSGTYGGALNAAYNGLTVLVSSSGSDSRNPFFFSGAAGGGSAIPIGSSGTTTRTVSINTSVLPPSYKLIGYSICPAGGGCTSANLAYGGPYYRALASGATSFNASFGAGRAYHMRWIFKNTVGISCGVFTTTPETLDGSMKFKATATVRFSVAYAPVAPTVSLSFSPAVPMNGNRTIVTPVVTATSGGSLATATFGADNALQIGPTGATGQYTATWRYDDASVAPVTCTDTFTVANMPYVAVYGGDVAVGQSPLVDTTCYQNDDGGAYSWNNYTTDFKGAGAEYAVMALGKVQEFASNLDSSPPNVLRMMLANTGSQVTPFQDVAGGWYGGVYGDNNTPCDFLSDVTAAPENGSSISLPSSVTGEVEKYASSDVKITNNITYSSTSWASLSAIPSFKLVVEGDIYIDSSVTQLDGVYVALATYDEATDTYTGGHIYTCAVGATMIDISSATYYDKCNTKLTVNGAFVAKQVVLGRTFGTLGQSSSDTTATPSTSNAAEVFNYSPELWLPRGTATPSLRYKSITGLPPVL